ncbi:membrane protein insertion efficiency factor YidD [Lichenicola sp.]|uniref:membrane protein insertion efficiency factor YidD n=1 Tax=Lichenicola sp. TaxID=2804529 RepID=UPI003AFF8715
MLGPNCRFVPSCSDYAIEALMLHGAFRGTGLAGARILRCNPWHPGGHDPVPSRPSSPRLTSSRLMSDCRCGIHASGLAAAPPSFAPTSLDRDRPVR